MEFKKCLRCGCFFMSNNDICCNCAPKDQADIAKLNDFIEDNGEIPNLVDLSVQTGITTHNLSRFLKEDYNPSNPSFK